MSYTVFETSAPAGREVVVPTAPDALAVARRLASEGSGEPIITGGEGWVFTIDEFEDLLKS